MYMSLCCCIYARGKKWDYLKGMDKRDFIAQDTES
jgi:hypothetical protein